MTNRPLTAKGAVMTKEEIKRVAKALLSGKKHVFTKEQGFDKTRFKRLINVK